MDPTGLRDRIQEIADRYRLRPIGLTGRFLGIHRGILVDAREGEGSISILLGSPMADVSGEILREFSGFRNVAGAGVPTGWIAGVMEGPESGRQRASKSFCVVRLDAARIEEAASRFLEMPELVARDLHEHGAPPSIPCLRCGEKEASTLGLLDGGHAVFCAGCWERISDTSGGGRISTIQEVKWLPALTALVAGTAIGGFIWGFLQQPHRLDRFGLLAMLFPIGWGVAICWSAGSLAAGVTRSLRAAMFTSVLVSVIAGNIWGYSSFVVDRLQKELNRPIEALGWWDAVRLYFSAFPKIYASEAPFLLAGLLGAWIALRLLRREEYIEVL